MKAKTYSHLHVSLNKASSTASRQILSQRYSPALTSRRLVSIAEKKIRRPLKYDGRVGRYLIYKAPCPDGQHYYVATISNGK